MPDDFDARDDHGGWEGEDMPEEDGYRQPEPPWPAAGQPSYRDAPPRRWPARYGVPLVLTAVIAAVAGFLAVVAVRDLSARPAAANSVAPASGPAPSTGHPAPGTGPAPGRGQTVQLEMGGRVTAVSATLITVAGPDHQVTAAVTSATKVSGRVSDIGGVKAGDLVAVRITGADGKLTATAIQDPASLP
jgi:Domain of unknown function (DUF5666)